MASKRRVNHPHTPNIVMLFIMSPINRYEQILKINAKKLNMNFLRMLKLTVNILLSANEMV